MPVGNEGESDRGEPGGVWFGAIHGRRQGSDGQAQSAVTASLIEFSGPRRSGPTASLT